MDRTTEIKSRLKKVFAPSAVPPWLLVLSDRIGWLVERGGDVDFLAHYASVIVAFLRAWSAPIGVLWLGYLLLRRTDAQEQFSRTLIDEAPTPSSPPPVPAAEAIRDPIERLPLEPHSSAFFTRDLLSRGFAPAHVLRLVRYLNNGPDTVLRDWKAWAIVPGIEDRYQGRVLSHGEWTAIATGMDAPTEAVRVIGTGDVVEIKRHAPVLLGVALEFPGLATSDVDRPGVIVTVSCKDGRGGELLYGEGPFRTRVAFAINQRAEGSGERAAAIRAWYRKFGTEAMTAGITAFHAAIGGPFAERIIREKEGGYPLSNCLEALSRGDASLASAADAKIREVRNDAEAIEALLGWLEAYGHLLATGAIVLRTSDFERMDRTPYLALQQKYAAMRESLLDSLDSPAFDEVRSKISALVPPTTPFSHVKPSGPHT